MNKEMVKEVFQYLEENQEKMVEDLKTIVSMNSYTPDVEDTTKVMEHLKSLFEEIGFNCDLVDVGPNAPTLVGIYNENIDGKPVLFSGHADTVIKKDAYETKFRVEDNKSFGPGVLDMKGGIITGLYAIKALINAGFNERPIKIAFSGDEEIGHYESSGSEALQNAAKGSICAFNLETGLLDNSLCVGRKGRLLSKIHVIGVGSHAGNDFLTGRNAIAEMAHKIIEIQNLTDLDKGTTVTSSIISGGTVSNAIPQDCYLEVECRFENLDEMENHKEKIKSICNKIFIDGTKTEIEISEGFAPFEATDQVLKFYNFIKETAEENNLTEVKQIKLGGSSDAAYIQLAGVPVICSIGIQGQWNHTTREYALLDSMVERGKLLTSVVLNLNNYKE